jgi:hypothetical protein
MHCHRDSQCAHHRSAHLPVPPMIKTRNVIFAVPYFASPSDFSALPLSSSSAFMNAAKPAESR